MSETISLASRNAANAAFEALKGEFLGEALDDLNRLSNDTAEIRGGQVTLDDVLQGSFLLAVRLKGGSASYDLALLGVAASRFEDYLSNVENASDHTITDIQIYLDVLIDMVEAEAEGRDIKGDLVRNLPMRRSFDPAMIKRVRIEVMLVMPEGAARKMIEREIQECGYSVTSVSSPFTALELIVRTQPDLAILSSVLPELSGVEIAIGLKSMPQTRNTAVAIITSHDKNHGSLALLPETVSIIRKGTSFGDDLAEALKDQFLM
ncbi:response regulator [Rhodovibrionaceae bacterium A322]